MLATKRVQRTIKNLMSLEIEPKLSISGIQLFHNDSGGEEQEVSLDKDDVNKQPSSQSIGEEASSDEEMMN